jgi:phosphoribosylglycinamide formyltransferase-1
MTDRSSGGARPRIGVLLSGRGSNFQAIANAVQSGFIPAELALVVSNRSNAPGLELARAMGLPTRCIASLGREREEYDREVVAVLKEAGVELVCLAGFMRLLSGYFIRAFPQRILNIHPSLLPAFPGLDAQRQALDYGVKYSGCTVHIVDETLDGGPIVSQAVVPVLDSDDEQTLAARILEQEHRIYPEAIRIVLSGRFRMENRRIILIDGAANQPSARGLFTQRHRERGEG